MGNFKEQRLASLDTARLLYASVLICAYEFIAAPNVISAQPCIKVNSIYATQASVSSWIRCTCKTCTTVAICVVLARRATSSTKFCPFPSNTGEAFWATFRNSYPLGQRIAAAPKRPRGPNRCAVLCKRRDGSAQSAFYTVQ